MFLLIFFVLGAGAALIIAYLLALVFMVIYTLVSYLFESMFLSRVYHRKKDKHAWISYIPFVNKYFYGNLVGCRIQGIIIAVLDFITCIYIYLFFFHVDIAMNYFFVFMGLVFLSFILNIYISHKIYDKTLPKFSGVLTVLSVLFVIARPIILFLLRNREELLKD